MLIILERNFIEISVPSSDFLAVEGDPVVAVVFNGLVVVVVVVVVVAVLFNAAVDTLFYKMRNFTEISYPLKIHFFFHF